jgi:hypothetical protein
MAMNIPLHSFHRFHKLPEYALLRLGKALLTGDLLDVEFACRDERMPLIEGVVFLAIARADIPVEQVVDFFIGADVVSNCFLLCSPASYFRCCCDNELNTIISLTYVKRLSVFRMRRIEIVLATNVYRDTQAFDFAHNLHRASHGGAFVYGQLETALQ